jgi:hypothetical protein
VLRRRPGRLRRLLPPLLLQDVAAILLVLGVVVAGTGWLASHLMLQPRMASGSTAVANHVHGLRSLLAALPENERGTVLDHLPWVSLARMSIDDPSAWPVQEVPDQMLLRRKFDAISRAVPDAQWLVSPAPRPQVWFTVPGRQGEEWVRLALNPRLLWAQPLSRLLLACAMAAAVWVVLHGWRRARLLADAAARLEGALGEDHEGAEDWAPEALA